MCIRDSNPLANNGLHLRHFKISWFVLLNFAHTYVPTFLFTQWTQWHILFLQPVKHCGFTIIFLYFTFTGIRYYQTFFQHVQRISMQFGRKNKFDLFDFEVSSADTNTSQSFSRSVSLIILRIRPSDIFLLLRCCKSKDGIWLQSYIWLSLIHKMCIRDRLLGSWLSPAMMWFITCLLYTSRCV